MVRVALLGSGTWGKNIARALLSSPLAEVVAVADVDPSALAAANIPHPLRAASFEAALAQRPEAVLIATPSETHAALATWALDAGLDVFVEKPLALCPEDADRLALRAAALGRVHMVGHVLRYHPTVRRLIDLARAGDLGPVRALHTERLSARQAGSTSDDRGSSALWALGPHDLSLLHALDPRPVTSLHAHGSPAVDVTLRARLAGGLEATIALSRRHPSKERRVTVAGAHAIAVVDDVRAPDRVTLAERHRSTTARVTREIIVPWAEPLATELEHFLTCVMERRPTLTPFEEGAWVVRALRDAERVAEPSRAAVAAG